MAAWQTCGLVIGRVQVRISAGATCTKVYSAYHPSGVGKWVPAAAGKAKAGIAHSASGWNAGRAGKIVSSLDNACCTWVP